MIGDVGQSGGRGVFYAIWKAKKPSARNFYRYWRINMVERTTNLDPTTALFEQAVREHSRRLLGIARAIVGYRASPEDVLQQALLNLYTHRNRYDWHEPGGLMRRTVVNEALRILRQPRLMPVVEDHPGREDEVDREMVRNETVREVREAIQKLPEHFRAALVLCEYENMPYAEIAQTLNASVPQIKTWLHRGRKQLAKLLKEKNLGPDDEPSLPRNVIGEQLN